MAGLSQRRRIDAVDDESGLTEGSKIGPRQICPAAGLVSRVTPVHTAMRNCTRDEGRPFEVGNQVLISSHRKLLWSKAMVVNVAESRNKISTGMIERGERKRTAAEVSKAD
jgi:hypothetical protein